MARLRGLSTVATELDGEVVGKELEMDDGEDGADVIGDVGRRRRCSEIDDGKRNTSVVPEEPRKVRGASG